MPRTRGLVTKYWDVTCLQSGSNRTTSVASDVNTANAVAGDIETRTRESDGRVTDLRYNFPSAGMRYRAPGVASSVYQFPIVGTGINLSINSAQTSQSQAHVYVMSVVK